jgi:hypothetical protein
VKRKSTPGTDLFGEISGGEIEMDTFPSPLASRNRPSIEEKGREGEREEKKKGREKKLKSPEGDFLIYFHSDCHHPYHHDFVLNSLLALF